MRVLLDENLDRRLKQRFKSSIEVLTVGECGWKGKKNGELLQLASQEFDVFITADQNLENQLNPANYEIGIIVLRAPTNRLAEHDPLIPRVLQQLNSTQTGTVIRIGGE